MTADESFVAFLNDRAHHDLPWEIRAESMRPIFMAGWHAHARNYSGNLELIPAPTVFTEEQKREALSHCGKPGDNNLSTLIYAAYPRKVGKVAAIKAIQKAMERGATNLLFVVRQYADATAKWPAADKQYIPHPATWFNKGMYDDDPKEWQRGAATTSQFSKTTP